MEVILLARVENVRVGAQYGVLEQRRRPAQDGETGHEGGWRDEITVVLLVDLVARPGRECVLADLLPADLVSERRVTVTDTVMVQRDGPSPSRADAVPAFGANTIVANRPCNGDRVSTWPMSESSSARRSSSLSPFSGRRSSRIRYIT